MPYVTVSIFNRYSPWWFFSFYFFFVVARNGSVLPVICLNCDFHVQRFDRCAMSNDDYNVWSGLVFIVTTTYGILRQESIITTTTTITSMSEMLSSTERERDRSTVQCSNTYWRNNNILSVFKHWSLEVTATNNIIIISVVHKYLGASLMFSAYLIQMIIHE